MAAIYSKTVPKEEKPQIILFKDLTGFPLQLTNHKSGITSFKPIGKGILYLADNPDHQEDLKNKYGGIIHSEKDTSASNLYYFNISQTLEFQHALKLVDEKQGKKIPKPLLDLNQYMNTTRKIEDIQVPNFGDGLFIINTRERDDLFFMQKKKVFLMEINLDSSLNMYLEFQKTNAKDKAKKETFGQYQCRSLNLPEESTVITFSPDDSKLLVTLKPDGKFFYHQTELSIISIDQLQADHIAEILVEQCITKTFDHESLGIKWVASGIYVSSPDKSSTKMHKIGETGISEFIDYGSYSPSAEFSISDDDVIVDIISSPEKYYEIAYIKDGKMELITDLNNLLANWEIGTSESIFLEELL